MSRYPCALCLEDLGLPCCGGLMCRHCLERWIAVRIQAGNVPTCPLCRAELVLTSDAWTAWMDANRQVHGVEEALRDSNLRGGFFRSKIAGIIRKMLAGAFFVDGVRAGVDAARESREGRVVVNVAAVAMGMVIGKMGYVFGTVATMAPGIAHLLLSQAWVTAQLVVRRAWMDARHAFHEFMSAELVPTGNANRQAHGAEQALRDSNLHGGFFRSKIAGIIRKMFGGAFFVAGVGAGVDVARESREGRVVVISATVASSMVMGMVGYVLGTVATIAPDIVHLLLSQAWITAQLVVSRACMDARHAFREFIDLLRDQGVELTADALSLPRHFSDSVDEAEAEDSDGYAKRSTWRQGRGVQRRNSRYDMVQRLLEAAHEEGSAVSPRASMESVFSSCNSSATSPRRGFQKLRAGPAQEQVGPQSFECLSLVGRGAFAEVYHVRQRSTGESFAMKVQHKDG
ncbi:pkgB [Symbiodinium sp. KB8]|nr:pkgB [Symbiodinium sp. KB8]